MVGVEYHSDLKDVQCDGALGKLLSDDVQQAPFDRLAWWQGLAGHCGIDPLLVAARDGDGLAVLPLRRDGKRLAGLANWYTFRLRPVISPGADGAALLATIARSLAERTHRVELSPLPDEDGSATLLEQAFARAGWLVRRGACDTNHYLEVRGRSFAEYLASRPGALRSTLRRKAGKIACEVLTRFDAGAWAEYEAIYAQSWKPGEGSPAFLRAFAEAEGAAGRLRLGIARGQRAAIAAQMWSVEGRTAFIHKLAHRESAAALSPGTALSAAMLRHVIDDDRVETIDFGTGNDAYQRDWMEAVRPRYRLLALRAGDPRNWAAVAKSALLRLAGRANHG